MQSRGLRPPPRHFAPLALAYQAYPLRYPPGLNAHAPPPGDDEPASGEPLPARDTVAEGKVDPPVSGRAVAGNHRLTAVSAATPGSDQAETLGRDFRRRVGRPAGRDLGRGMGRPAGRSAGRSTGGDSCQGATPRTGLGHTHPPQASLETTALPAFAQDPPTPGPVAPLPELTLPLSGKHRSRTAVVTLPRRSHLRGKEYGQSHEGRDEPSSRFHLHSPLSELGAPAKARLRRERRGFSHLPRWEGSVPSNRVSPPPCLWFGDARRLVATEGSNPSLAASCRCSDAPRRRNERPW